LLLYPTPDSAGTILYRYIFDPPYFDDVNVHPIGGAVHGETIQAAVLSAWECINGDYTGVHTSEFEKQLVASIRIDKGQRP
jgi:hypothetical protein